MWPDLFNNWYERSAHNPISHVINSNKSQQPDQASGNYLSAADHVFNSWSNCSLRVGRLWCSSLCHQLTRRHNQWQNVHRNATFGVVIESKLKAPRQIAVTDAINSTIRKCNTTCFTATEYRVNYLQTFYIHRVCTVLDFCLTGGFF